MRWLYKLPLRLRSLFRKEETEHELSDEVQFHLQRQIEQNVAQGMPPDEARFAALREFGAVEQIKEECREMRNVGFLENFVKDIRLTIRTFVKSPGFALVVVMTLALGIGANTAIFNLVNGILLRPLPYPESDRLVNASYTGPVPEGAVLGFQQRIQTMELAAYSLGSGFNLSREGNASRLNGTETTANLFSLLRVNAMLGRVFRAGDEQPGQDRIAILSYGLWQNQFGGDAEIVGRWIMLDDVPRQVVGVMPADFSFPSSSIQVWVPARVDRQSLWGDFRFWMIGRVKPGASFVQSRAEFKAAAPPVVKTFPWQMGQTYAFMFDIGALQQDNTADVRKTLLLLLGAVALILLLACVNVANLLLARSATRQREMAIRAALGASRSRIIRQLLSESLLLALAGGVCGILLAFMTVSLIKSVLPVSTPRLAEVRMDAYVLGFSLVISLVTGLFFGLAPAIHASRPVLDRALKSGAPAVGLSRGRRRISSSLAAAQIALAVILVSGAGLLIKSLYKLARVETGFRTDHLLTAHITPASSFCAKSNDCRDFYDEMLQRARALPGVKMAALSDGVPLYWVGRTVVAVENSQEFTPEKPYSVWEFTVSPDYVPVMDIRLLQGRNFEATDLPNSPKVVLVNRKVASLFWPGQDAIGKRLKLSWMKEWRTVVGVVEDVRAYKVPTDRVAEAMVGQIYFPVTQSLGGGHPVNMNLVLRTREEVDAVARELPGLVAGINPAVPVTRIRSMDDILRLSVEEPRSTMWLFTAFAVLALTLGLVGIYSVVSYSVAQRTREIGIRMAMGAEKLDVLRMVLRQASQLALIGIAAGLVGAFMLTRFMASLLYGTRPADPSTFTAVCGLVGMAAILASYIPARRAAAVDPLMALRDE